MHEKDFKIGKFNKFSVLKNLTRPSNSFPPLIFLSFSQGNTSKEEFFGSKDTDLGFKRIVNDTFVDLNFFLFDATEPFDSTLFIGIH